jgi:glycosyltransferase involved in cell wall biosynthesis
MRKLKVLQLGTSGPLYGAERWILALVRNLESQRVESHIGAIADVPDSPVPLLDAAARLGLRFHSIEAPGRFNPGVVTALRHLILRQGFDIVHAHGYKADIAALLAARGTRAKTVATPHGWSYNSSWQVRLYERLDRASFRFFDAITPLSPELENGLSKRKSVACKLHFIPNGVDLLEVDDIGPAPAELQALKSKGPVVGYAGQLIARKNLPTLIRAFGAWNRGDASLILVGDGNQRAELEALAASIGIGSRTLFPGFRQNRLEWIRGFDIFVLPSLAEGVPRCLMEAMALGVATIASDIPGNRELIRHRSTGLLFAPGNADCLTQMLDSVGEPEARRSWTANARGIIERDYDAATMARKFETLFTSLVSAKSSRKKSCRHGWVQYLRS